MINTKVASKMTLCYSYKILLLYEVIIKFKSHVHNLEIDFYKKRLNADSGSDSDEDQDAVRVTAGR